MPHLFQAQHRPVLGAILGLTMASTLLAAPVQAAIIETGGSVAINGGAATTTTDSSSTGSVSVGESESSTDFATYGSYRTSVAQDGTFSASTSGSSSDFGTIGSGKYESSAYTQFSDVLTNTTAVAQEQLVTINLARGGASVQEFDFGGSGDVLATSLLLDLSFGSTSVYTSGYGIQNNGGSITASQLGSDIFAGVASANDSVFDWDAQTITVVLGVLNPGASNSFNYVFRSGSLGSITDAFCDVGEGSVCGSGNNFGDPVSFSLSSRAVGGPNPVPEPMTLALLGLGLFALVGSRRRRYR